MIFWSVFFHLFVFNELKVAKINYIKVLIVVGIAKVNMIIKDCFLDRPVEGIYRIKSSPFEVPVKYRFETVPFLVQKF